MPYCFVTSTTLSLFLSYLVVNLSSTKCKVYIETLILAGLVPMIWLQLPEEGGNLMRRISWMTGTGRPTPRPSTGPHPPSLGYSRLSVATVVVDTCQLLRDQILCVMRHFLIINLILTSIDKLALTELCSQWNTKLMVIRSIAIMHKGGTLLGDGYNVASHITFFSRPKSS